MAAYGLSLEAVDTFFQAYGVDGVRNLLHNPDRLPAIGGGSWSSAWGCDRPLGL